MDVQRKSNENKMDVRWKSNDCWLWHQLKVDYDVKRMSTAPTSDVMFNDVVTNDATITNCNCDAMRCELYNDGKRQCNGHHVVAYNVALQFLFIFKCLLHATPSFKGLRGRGLCMTKKVCLCMRERKNFSRMRHSPDPNSIGWQKCNSISSLRQHLQ
jgi:hypothetical protein